MHNGFNRSGDPVRESAGASRAVELWQFQAQFGVVVGIAAASSYTPLIATTTNWFTRHRSLAVALVSVGLGIGALTVAPLATWIIVERGWRTAMLVLGGIAWAVVVPAALLLRRPPAQPDEAGWATDGGGAHSVALALRTPQFATIALTYFACCAAHSGPIFHMVSYALSTPARSRSASVPSRSRSRSARRGYLHRPR